DPYKRGVAALSLSLLEPRRARHELMIRHEEASSKLERVFISAGLATCRHPDALKTLHEDLCAEPQVMLLRYVWKRAVIVGLMAAERDDRTHSTAWADVMSISPLRCQDELNFLATGEQPGAMSRLSNWPPGSQASGNGIFFSYSQSDRA